MPSVSATLKMFDQMTRPLQQVTQALNLTINAMDNMSNSANRDIRITNSLNAARGAIQRANAGLQELVSSQERARSSQNNLNNSFNNGSSALNNLTSKAKGLALAYATVETIKKGMQITDDYVNQGARLSLINDGLQTQEQLQMKIYQAAQRSKAVYGDTVANVAKLGLLAKDAFSSNDEVIAFSELMNKSFKISGASTSEATNGMYQLTQAMASGRLQGDEFRSIMENAPMLAQSIANYTKVSMGELRKMSSEGKITSDIIKRALFKSADDINKKFNSMPNTFESVWVKIKNAALMQFSGIMKKVNELLNAPGVMTFINGIISIIGVLALVVGKVIDIGIGVANIFNWIGQVIQNNWDFIGPIFYSFVGVILALMFQQLIALIPVIWGVISALAMKATILIDTAIGWALNHFWIVLIGLAIGILISIVIQSGITFEQVCGFIGGVVGGLFAFIYNLVSLAWNLFASFAEFFANLFVDPVYAVKKLFYDLTTTVLGWIANLAKALTDLVNMIPGVEVNLHSGLDNFISGIKAPTTDKAVVKIPRMQQKDYKEMATTGYNKGASIGKGIANFASNIGGKLGNANNIPTMPSIPMGGAKAPKGLGDDAKKGLKGANGHLKNIDDKIDISNEYLEMMRDLAEQESIQNFVTLTPTVQVTTGDVKEEADINKIISKIEEYMENELVNSAEGVYN